MYYLIGALLASLLVLELITWSIFGKPISKEPNLERWFNKEHTYSSDYTIIHLDRAEGARYISKVLLPISTKWYINYDGNNKNTVWRWSKLHKQIEKEHAKFKKCDSGRSQ